MPFTIFVFPELVLNVPELILEEAKVKIPLAPYALIQAETDVGLIVSIVEVLEVATAIVLYDVEVDVQHGIKAFPSIVIAKVVVAVIRFEVST